ncbi:MAG: AAA family ATPase [Planctomycetaceae bacterium]|nr:AAA family ATPase [Planctomycetaceae bacterium]
MPPTDAVYFKSMTVRNIRCFRDEPQMLDLTDHDGTPAMWTLILGDNGVGKTTLLQSLGYIWWLWYLGRSLIANGQVKTLGAGWGLSLPPNWRSEQGDPYIQLEFGSGTDPNAAPISVGFLFGEKSLNTEIDDGNVPDVFVCGYGPDRSLTRTSECHSEHSVSSLYETDEHPLVNSRTWLRELDYSASKKSDVQSMMKARLKQVKETLIDLLPDVSDIRITQPSRKKPEPEVEFRTPYGWVELSGVAYGYQSLVAWVVDFAYRLFERYPDSDDPLAEPAICLVDELDLHLHPSWQRDVMAFLSQKFPRTQFIATVHSPLVVQAAPSVNANVAVLRRVQGEPFDHVVIDNDPEIIRSWRLDQLLASDLFATVRGPITPRNPAVQEKIDERRKILSKPKLTKRDRERLAEIAQEIDVVPVTETQDHQEIQELIKKSYELLAKEKDGS